MSLGKTKYLALLLTLILSACSSQQVAVSESIKIESAKAADEAKFTPQQAIEEATKQLADAKNKELNYYSPLHLSQAKQSIEEALEYLKNPPKKIKNAALMSAIAAQKFISDGYKNKETVEQMLKFAFDHQNVLKELKSPKIMKDDYEDVVEVIDEMINYIERGKLSKFTANKKPLQVAMSLVEINTLKHTNLDLAYSFMKRARKIDAEDYAERTYKKAEQTLEQANTYIEKNYRNRKGVVKVGEKALWGAKKTYYVALEAERVIQMTDEEAETHILKMYDLLNKAPKKANGVEIEPQELRNTASKLVVMVEKYDAKIEKAERALAFYIDKNTVAPEKSIASELPEDEQLEIQTIDETEPLQDDTTKQLDQDGFEMME